MTREEVLAIMARDQLPAMSRYAQFSDDGLHRLWLFRQWDTALPQLGVCMLNPSSAGVHNDDPTMLSVMRIARFNGFGGVQIVNLCSFATFDPDVAAAAGWPIHHENAEWQNIAASTGYFALGWGANVRDHKVLQMAAAALLWRLKVTPLVFRRLADGTPGHPLYLPAATPLTPHLEPL